VIAQALSQEMRVMSVIREPLPGVMKSEEPARRGAGEKGEENARDQSRVGGN
jgi:hypothetical protein